MGVGRLAISSFDAALEVSKFEYKHIFAEDELHNTQATDVS